MGSLFQLSSIVDNFYGRDGVTVEWFRAAREQPQVPYEELILDYDLLLDHYLMHYQGPSLEYATSLRKYDERYVCELLTEIEVEQLQEYVARTRGCESAIRELSTPIPHRDLKPPFGETPLGPDQGRYELWAEEGYDLPFKIEGFFDLRGCSPSIELDRRPTSYGVRFLSEALDSLGLVGDLDAKRLESVVRALYDNSGLYVDHGKTKLERLREKVHTLAIKHCVREAEMGDSR
jgi:hypothetical protein